MTRDQEPPDQRRWAATRYGPAAAHHRSFDDWFLERHPPQPHDDVVDLGCGSGEFTARLARLVPDGSVVGVDADPAMLEAARRHEAPNLSLRRAAAQELDRVCGPASADLVVSRAMFHWLPLEDYPRCYQAVLGVLRPGGWFHAESGGAGNVRRVGELLDEVARELGRPGASVSFPDAGVAAELLEQAGFELPEASVTTVAQRRTFDRDQLLAFLRTQAAMAYDLGPSHPLHDRFLARLEERLDELRRHDGTYDQTFVRLHVLCRRPA